MRRDLAAGRPGAFTVDGPRGPARVVQPGVVWLAGATGHPILPYHVEASRSWTLRSWDRTQIPRPFSTVAIAIGAPIEVPVPTPEVLDEKCREVASALATLEARALGMLPNPVEGG